MNSKEANRHSSSSSRPPPGPQPSKLTGKTLLLRALMTWMT
jgi:hypothetical protein